jgi:hypothetical protein
MTSVGGMVGAGRLTFGVCQDCGVQSPPVTSPEQLRSMGWKVNHLKFYSLATCPKCDAKSKTADEE